MKLEFMYLPTQDLDATLALYRDTLGFDELWREGELTVGLAPGTDVALMIDAAAEPGCGPGPIFITDDVKAFHATHDGAYELDRCRRSRSRAAFCRLQAIPAGTSST